MKIFLYLLAGCMAAALLIHGKLYAGEIVVRTQILMGTVPVTLALDQEHQGRDAALTAMSRAFQQARRIETRVSRDPALQRRAHRLSERTLGYFDTRYGLGGIAKGYIVDQVAQALRSFGFRSFLINAGGDIWAENRLDDTAWEIELDSFPDPICISQGAIASSGTGERGHHIYDPSTGRPAINTDRSVTVFAPKTETADALATAVFAAGPNKVQLINHLLQMDPSLYFIRINTAGQVDIRGKLNIKCPSKEEFVEYHEKLQPPRLSHR